MKRVLYRSGNIVTLLLVCAAMTAQINPNVLPESTYPFWPSYQYLELEDLDTIQAQQWIEADHVIDGWDWSLPDFVEPSPRSLVGLQRNLSVTKEFKPVNLQFKSNSIGILWVKWRDIEPTPGNYNFTPVINRINQANSVGSDIILRILGHSKSRAGDINKGEAPLWLEDLGVNLLPQSDPKHNLNFDPSHPEFHKHYLALVEALANTEIPQRVKAAYVGYASHSYGDEGIGPYSETQSQANDTVQHVRERLDAWENAFRGMEYKMFMGAPLEYGFKKGFGFRRGFVEMYLYRIPARNEGQYIDENGYLSIDENAPVFKYQCFNGDVNEEYEEAWATASRDFRFGNTTNSYPYRYFTSTLRALQMHCTYIHTTGHLVPKMLPFLSQELGRTVEDTPDAWSFLRTSYLRASTYENNDYRDRVITEEERAEGIETKNFERWLYQRDAQGYETTPVVQIQHAIKMWMVQEDKYYDFIARRGKKIGFNVDDRVFPGGEQPMAIKVTFFDSVPGTLKLVYKNNQGIQDAAVTATGQDTIRTATFVINARLDDTGFDHDFDFILESEEEVPVVMVRVVKTREDYENTDQSPYGGEKRKIPGIIEAEHYDVGDPGFAWQDDEVKEGVLDFRPYDNVDVIRRDGASNDTTVSFTRDGEWLEYTVEVLPGKYDITLYYFCGEPAGNLVVSLGNEILDTIAGIRNLGWSTRDSITTENISIAGGNSKILRLEFSDGAGFDIDAIAFKKKIIAVTGISLNGCPTGDLALGETIYLSAEVSPFDADDPTVIWHSSDSLIASINPDGMVNILDEGTILISATANDGGFVDSCKLNIVRPVVSVYGVAIGDCPSYILTTGGTHQLIANVAPPEATDPTVTWSSSDPDIATVDENGLVKGLSQGTAKITITTNDGGYTNTCSLGVMSSGNPVTGIIMDGCPSSSVAVDSIIQLTAFIQPSDAEDLTVSWSSSNSEVASVDANGLVSALSEGSTTITVTSNTGGFTKACEVVVSNATNTYKVDGNQDRLIRIYPNPAENELYFNFPESLHKKEIKIYNLFGQLLLSGETTNSSFKLGLDKIRSAEMMIVEVKHDEYAFFRKIIKN